MASPRSDRGIRSPNPHVLVGRQAVLQDLSSLQAPHHRRIWARGWEPALHRGSRGGLRQVNRVNSVRAPRPSSTWLDTLCSQEGFLNVVQSREKRAQKEGWRAQRCSSTSPSTSRSAPREACQDSRDPAFGVIFGPSQHRFACCAINRVGGQAYSCPGPGGGTRPW
ncbi:hypothetical protein WJX72_001146 [[Myrmecia] bisecta]|uniref:Uncharacterized protein n=1 Tax=[Myrmecia] bisecta TaxID=41462 RepID=A0AAW1PVK0_9CHLO